MKGLFTQGAMLLLERPIELAELEPLLAPFGTPRAIPGSDQWPLGLATLLLPLAPPPPEGANGAAGAEGGSGHVAIDVVPHPWPDDMGDPETSPEVFTAWSTGHFGPFAFPQGFERACQQAWVWPEAQAKPPSHQAFIRLRTSYIFGAGPDGNVMPENYDPLLELIRLTQLAQALASHPAVVCYFNPSGESVLPVKSLNEALAWARENKLPPLDVWSNVRFFNLGGIADGWFLMDSVGMWQLDTPDHEVFLPGDQYDFKEVEGFLRNVALFVLSQEHPIEDGDTIDGPGGVHWRAHSHAESFTAPPRRVLRWFAVDGIQPPPELVGSTPKN